MRYFQCSEDLIQDSPENQKNCTVNVKTILFDICLRSGFTFPRAWWKYQIEIHRVSSYRSHILQPNDMTL